MKPSGSAGVRSGVIALVCLAVGLGAATTVAVGAAPQLLGAPPAFVAPGELVELRVASAESGVLTVRRIEGEAPAIETKLPILAGQPTLVRFRPLTIGTAVVELSIDDGPVATARIRVRPLRLLAVGDVSPGSAIEAVRLHGPAWHWLKVGPWLRSQDLVVANLETAIGSRGAPWPNKTFRFLAPESTAQAAARVGGIDAVSLANNHSLDYGRATLLGGLGAIRRAGIEPFGAGRNLEAAAATSTATASATSQWVFGSPTSIPPPMRAA